METLEERYRNYPDLAMEARQLEIYQRLVELAQVLDQLIKKKPSTHKELEKETHTREGEQMKQMGKENQENKQNESLTHGKESQEVLVPKMLSNSCVPQVDEDWGNRLWDAVKKTYGKTGNEAKPPIEEIDFD